MNTERARLTAAAGAAVALFSLYHSTLLPGMDFGDTPSFQTMAGSALITPRDGYPLYFAIGALFARPIGDPAFALNLFSAVAAGLACGLLLLVSVKLCGSLASSVAATLLFGVSYTFWSQAVIAEVYALHTVFLALTIWCLLWWAERPSTGRLALFFISYALGFGNHLSMILLAPGFTIFLLISAPGGWRSLFTVRTIGLATLCAVAGALQYGWNLRTLWLAPIPPHGVVDALQTFWFDVTKSDWRETMVLHIPANMMAERLRLYTFDLHQQFGWVPVIFSACGAFALWRTSWQRALLLLSLYLVNVGFALGYNVGDSHVFFLPSHALLALMMAPGLVWLSRMLRTREALSAGAIVLAGVRAYGDFPALDRSADRRPLHVVEQLTAGLNDRTAILVDDLNWQVDNGMNYYEMHVRPDLAVVRMPDVLSYMPALVRDNQAVGRDVALTARARASLVQAYGPLFRVEIDPRNQPQPLAEQVRTWPAGTRYALAVLQPWTDSPVDDNDLQDTLSVLTGGARHAIAHGPYAVVAGRVGRPPTLVEASTRPFRRTVDLDGVPVEVRMESWLAFDTIRRMGFGHVVAARRHTMILERGVNLVAFDAKGEPLQTAYAAGIFAPELRYVIR